MARSTSPNHSMNIAWTSSNDSRQRPAPITTASSGVSTKLTGTSAAWESRSLIPRSSDPAPDQVNAAGDHIL